MPAEFNSFGIRFLYPENWTIVDREEGESDEGVTLDLPSGGFVSMELTAADQTEHVVERVVKAIANDYDTVEREDFSLDLLPAGTPVTDLRFYYLDLLIISRIVVLPIKRDAPGPLMPGPSVLVMQLQAESRDFDKNEPVFAAILKQIVDANTAS